MFKPRQLLFSGLVILFFSCKNDHTYTYAIKDFRQSLQPHLTNIVAKGIVTYYDPAIRSMATDKELVELSESEHPILRASAFREMLDRKSFDHFDILMNNLDDTAAVLSDEGEFGISRRTVSDDILYTSNWKTREAKNKTVEEVLTKHNYLRSAYLILEGMHPQEKYYPFIKDMATRPRLTDPDGYELAFDDIEYALYGLAKFKKKGDVKIINQLLMKNVWQLSYISFQLLKEYPDTTYLDVLQSYHRRQFYRFSGNRRDGFSGVVSDKADPEDFIKALAVQQNERSAKLFDTLLSRLQSLPCMPDKESIVNKVILEIWQHPCPAYARLRDKIKIKAEEILKGQISIPIERHNEPIDSSEGIIRWYP
jgi:hypothetical protein